MRRYVTTTKLAMKITFDIETTPQELRSFFGMPDIEPLQQEMMDAVRRNMRAGMEGFDPMTLMKPWLPGHMQNLESMQKIFWDSMTNAGKQANRHAEKEERDD